MDALLGIVFVVQLPSHQPEVLFQHPHPREPGSFDTADGNEDPTSSLTSSLALNAHTEPPVSCEASGPVGLPETLASAEDLRLRLRDCFGIPSNTFAKLMLPDEELCNRPFYLEIDAGQRRTCHAHGPWSHLLFASFPCNVAEFGRPEGRRAAGPPRGAGGAELEQRSKVQRFNVVHVLDSRRARRREKHTSTLWEVSAHLARALVSEEARVGYLSCEVRRLASHAQHGLGEEGLPPSAEASAPTELNAWGLDRLLTETFEGVQERGYSSLRVNGSILCQVCVFPKYEAPAPPSASHALTLTCAREELQQELPLDAADIVRIVVDAVDPTRSLGELMVRLALPLGTLQRVAQHLVYWKKARVVDVFQPHTRVAVAPGVNTHVKSPASTRFQEWQRQHKIKGVRITTALTFSEVVSAFSGGRKLEIIEEHFRQLRAVVVVPFREVFEWLVAEGLLVQVATYYHFLPGRAIAGSQGMQHVHVNTNIRREFCPQYLTEEELRLLVLRAADDHQHLFLCRFVVQFARAHVRADGCRFAALVESFQQGGTFGLQQAEQLLADNKDIFVPYLCQC